MHLLVHPSAPHGPIRNFEVHAECRADNSLRLSWRLDADLSQLRVPPNGATARVDGLWRHTCLEALIAEPRSPAYTELNFSPSGEWAAYRFTGYRSGMTPLDLLAAPEFHWRQIATSLELDVVLRLGEFLPGAGTDRLRLGLCAVIEEQSGTITYWALRHPAGEPDFHHADGFALELARPGSRAERETDRS